MLLKEYIIVKRRSKLDYKSSKIVKITIDCERNNYLRRKSSAKQKKIDSIKIDCSFRIIVLQRESRYINNRSLLYRVQLREEHSARYLCSFAKEK